MHRLTGRGASGAVRGVHEGGDAVKRGEVWAGRGGPRI